MEKKTRQGDNGENVKCQKAMKDYFLNDRVFLQLCTWWRLLTTRDAAWRAGRPSSGCHHRHHRHRHCKHEYFQLLCCVVYICDIGICYSRLSAWDTALLWADGIPSRRQLSLDGSTMDQQGWSKNISFQYIYLRTSCKEATWIFMVEFIKKALLRVIYLTAKH